MRWSLAPIVALVVTLLSTGPAEAYRSLRDARRALGHQQPTERVRAASWIGRQGAAVSRGLAAQLLEQTLSDPVPAVRRAGWNAMARLRMRAFWPELRRRLAMERSPEVMPAAIIALGAAGTHDVDGKIVDAFKDHPAPAIRVAVLTSLADMRSPLAAERARGFLALTNEQDRGWIVRSSAMLAIAKAGDADDAAHAAKVYADKEWSRSWFARSAYARLVAAQMPDQVRVLTALAEDRDPRVGVTAATGLARAGHTQAFQALLRSRRVQTRAVAAAAVAQAQLAEAYPRLRAMAYHDTSRRVRWAAAKALWHLRDPLGERLILIAVESREPAIWAEAVALLGQRTGAAHGRNRPAWRKELRRRR